MAKSIKFNDDTYIDATGIRDSSIAQVQSIINERAFNGCSNNIENGADLNTVAYEKYGLYCCVALHCTNAPVSNDVGFLMTFMYDENFSVQLYISSISVLWFRFNAGTWKMVTAT